MSQLSPCVPSCGSGCPPVACRSCPEARFALCAATAKVKADPRTAPQNLGCRMLSLGGTEASKVALSVPHKVPHKTPHKVPRCPPPTPSTLRNSKNETRPDLHRMTVVSAVALPLRPQSIATVTSNGSMLPSNSIQVPIHSLSITVSIAISLDLLRILHAILHMAE